MRRLIGSIFLITLAAGCANQLAINELTARNTVPPPGTYNRVAANNGGYYNPLSFFQPSGGNNPPPTMPANNFGGGAPTTPIANSDQTTSPFWNFPSANGGAPANNSFTDRWASRSAGPTNSFGGGTTTLGGASPPAFTPPFVPSASGFGGNNAYPNAASGNGFGNNNFGSNNFGTNGFGSFGGGNSANNNFGNSNYGRPNFGGFNSSGFSSATSGGFGSANSASNYNGGTNPISSFFNQLLNPPQSPNSPMGSRAANRLSPAPTPNGTYPAPGFSVRPANQQPAAPRFDFGPPRNTTSNESPIRINDSALRDLPRNPRTGVPMTDLGASSSTGAATATRPSSMPLNPLPANGGAPSNGQNSGDYIEVTRLPAGRPSAT